MTTDTTTRPAFNLAYATESWGAAADLKSLTAWNKRADRWFGLCDELSAARVAHVASPTPATAAWEAAALAAWSKGRMPSKDSKYTAYGKARRLVDYLALDLPYAQNREDLKAIAALVMSNMVGNKWADLKFVS